MTKYEKEIYEIVNASHSHMTAEQIFEVLRERRPQVVLATVYNNLNRLWDAGLIRRLSLDGMPDRYDRVERHDHLICKKCGKLTDIRLDDMTGILQAQLETPIIFYDLRLMYICEDCRKNAEDEH